jgi:hypothetical protein
MAKTAPLAAGLLQACDDEHLFGIDLTPVQRALLEGVENGHDLVHVWCLGRRSGKSLLAAVTGLWMCLLRPDLAEYVRRRERRYSMAVATNLRQSRIYVEQARSIVEGSPLLSGLLESATDDELKFANRTSLVAIPCTSRGGRGWPVMCLLMDEAAHMLDTDGNQAAEPIYRALSPSVAQFGDQARVIVASSPFGLDGFFAELYHAVEGGELPGAVAAHASTMEARPGFATEALELERRRDPDGYAAEYLAQFLPAGAGFLDVARLDEAAQRKHELRPVELDDPEAALDIGLVTDATALAIVGRDKTNPGRLRLALARSWEPKVGPLGFGPTLDEVADVLDAHGIRRVFIDQFYAIAAREHLARRGIYATVIPTTAASKSNMFTNLKTLLYGGGLELYQQPDLLAECRRIETVTTPGAATVRIRRVGHSHGDLVSALALVCSRIKTSAGRYGTSSLPDRGTAISLGPRPDGKPRPAAAVNGRMRLRQRLAAARMLAEGGYRRDPLAETLYAHGVDVYGNGGFLATRGSTPAPAVPFDPGPAHDAEAELRGYLGGER